MFHLLDFGPVVAFHWLARPGWPVLEVTSNVKQFGYRPVDFLAGHILYAKIIHPDDLEWVAQEVESYSLAGASRFLQEYRILTANGEVRWILDTTLVQRHKNGRVASYLGYLLDITDLRQARYDFLDSETKFHNFIEQARDGMILLDASGKIIEFNQAFAKMAQVDAQEATGRYVWDLPIRLLGDGPEILATRTKIIALYRQQRSNQVSDSLEQEVVLQNGARRVAQITAFPVNTRQGLMIGAVVRDVTEMQQAEQDRKRRIQELSLLYEATLLGLQAASQDELIEQVTTILGRFLSADNFGLLLFDPESQTLGYHASYVGPPPEAALFADFHARGVTGQVAQTGIALRFDNVSQSPIYWACAPGICSELCVPVKLGEKNIAVINVESKQPAAYSLADEHWLITLAGYLSTAIERQRLLESERRRRYEAEILRAATASLVDSLNIEEVLNAILENLQKVVEYDSASLFLYRDGGLTIAAARGLPDLSSQIGNVYPATDIFFARACLTHQPVLIGDVRQEPAFLGWGGSSYVRGWMGIPLFLHDETVGYLTVDSCKINAYQSQDIIMAQAFANHAALALEHARLYENVRDSFLQTGLALANAIEARDQYTGDHSQRLSTFAKEIGQQLGMTEHELEDLRWAGIFHDIGKIGVPDSILRKPGPLTPEEWQIMKQHPEIGAAILRPVHQLRNVIPIILAHQEKFDGSGYPFGLRAQEIPLGARVLAVVDAYSAMIDDRVYRKGCSHEQALEEIITSAGSHFDPSVVRVFLKIISAKPENDNYLAFPAPYF